MAALAGRLRVVQALGQIGPDARAAEAALKAALKDSEEEVRNAATDALARIRQKK